MTPTDGTNDILRVPTAPFTSEELIQEQSLRGDALYVIVAVSEATLLAPETIATLYDSVVAAHGFFILNCLRVCLL